MDLLSAVVTGLQCLSLPVALTKKGFAVRRRWVDTISVLAHWDNYAGNRCWHQLKQVPNTCTWALRPQTVARSVVQTQLMWIESSFS